MSQKTDQHYIDKVLLGDTRAFSALIERYKHMVYTLALKVTRNKEDAEEIAQDVFLKAHGSLATFKGDSKFSTWLYKIAYHRSLDRIKSNKRKLKTTQIEVSDDYNLASLDNALDQMIATDRKTLIKNAIDQLSADDNIIITLHYYKGLSLKEIAEVTGISANTVKVRLFRSRKRLADILKRKAAPEITRNYDRG